ncbi:hypothetical protein AB1I39_19895, partial [Chromobacterium vaccinii]
MKYRYQATLILASILLAACGGGGGGGGGGATGSGSSSVPSPSIKQTYSGYVIDGYVANATVCLDLNQDGKCGTDEPQTKTDASGHYEFSVVGASKDMPLLAVVPLGAVDKDHGAVKEAYTLSAAPGGTIITPLSTLTHANMRVLQLDRQAAENKLAEELQVPVSVVRDDFIKQSHAKAANQARMVVAMLSMFQSRGMAGKDLHEQLLKNLQRSEIKKLLLQADANRLQLDDSDYQKVYGLVKQAIEGTENPHPPVDPKPPID